MNSINAILGMVATEAAEMTQETLPSEGAQGPRWHDIAAEGYPAPTLDGMFFWCWRSDPGRAVVMRYHADIEHFADDRTLLQPVTHWLGPIEQPEDPR